MLPPDLISTREAAQRCGVHHRTVRRWVAAGRLRGYRIGPRLLKVELSQVLGQMQPVEPERVPERTA